MLGLEEVILDFAPEFFAGKEGVRVGVVDVDVEAKIAMARIRCIEHLFY